MASTCLIGDDCATIIDDTLELLIIKCDGERQLIILNSSSTQDDLSREIQQNLLWIKKFKFESDGQKTLKAWGIPNHSTIYLLSRLLGGGGMNPVAFSSLTNSLEVGFSSQAPPGRIIREGLSLEGICQSNKCCRYQYKVIVHLGFGDFNINKEVHDARCPMCGNETKDNFAPYFYQCKFIIEGLKETKKFKLEGTQNELKSSKTFKSEGLDNSDWEWLIIKVKKL